MACIAVTDAPSPDSTTPRPFSRWEALVLVVPLALWSSLVLLDSHFVDPDSYLHLGVARRMVEDGWLRTFEWLPHTTLSDPYPNMYFGQHLLLVPFAALFDPDLGLRLAILTLSMAGAASLYLVLRRNGVRYPACWVAVGLIGSPVALSYALSIKGAATFLIVLPWFIDAVWRSDSPRQTPSPTGWKQLLTGPWRIFLVAWLSTYVYVGATVFIGFVVAHLLITRLWTQRWDLRPLLATLAGLLLGMLLHPSWPAHWDYVLRELLTIFERDPNLVPGDLRGAEWAIVQTDMLLRLAGLALAAWVVALLAVMYQGLRIERDTATGTLAAFGLLLGGLLSGTKLIQLFVLFSILALPRLFTQLWQYREPTSAPRAFGAVLVVLGLAASAHSYTTLRTELAESHAPCPADYRALAQWLSERTQPREMVLVPWDDMPGLFLFGTDQRFMAGFNVRFLRDHDEQRYNAFVFFVRGQIEDPEVTMVRFFDGARFVVLPRQPNSQTAAQLPRRLEQRREHFTELASPVSHWRIFQRQTDNAATP